MQPIGTLPGVEVHVCCYAMAMASEKGLCFVPIVPFICGCTQWQSTAGVPFTLTRFKQKQRLKPIAAVATGPEDDADAPLDLTASFAEELQKRQASQAAATEVESATDFDGAALLEVLLNRYNRSYDVTLVKREYMGRPFVAMNVMWAYAEQKSFALSEDEYMNRLDYVAAALRQWGVVTKVKDAISSRRNRPRVGKAISIMLDLDDSLIREWFG